MSLAALKCAYIDCPSTVSIFDNIDWDKQLADFNWRKVSGAWICSMHTDVIGKSQPIEKTDELDNINHPSHYTQYKGLEIIDLVEQMNFNRGNAVKYIARAGYKNPETELEDLRKAVWYLTREIARVGKDA